MYAIRYFPFNHATQSGNYARTRIFIAPNQSEIIILPPVCGTALLLCRRTRELHFLRASDAADERTVNDRKTIILYNVHHNERVL